MIVTVALLRHGGSHFIRPIVSKLGGHPIIEPGNFGAPLDKAQGPVVVFLRDPRDRMVSTLRWWMERGKGAERYGEPADQRLAGMLADGFLSDMAAWAKIWCRWPGALTVRFEELRADGSAQVQRIADHLGVKANASAVFGEVYTHGRTYTGAHSVWQQMFGPLSLDVWAKKGGPELLEIMGYAA